MKKMLDNGACSGVENTSPILSVSSVCPSLQKALTESSRAVRAAARMFFGGGCGWEGDEEEGARGAGAGGLTGGTMNCDLSGWKGRTG
jgi:hypothetical protein